MLPVLRRHADGRRLYDRNQDLYHWNGNALSIAYQAIADHLRTKNVDFNPQTLAADYSIVPFTTRQDSPFYNTAYGHQQTVYIRLTDPLRLNNKTGDDMPAMPSSPAEIWKNPILLENSSCPSGGLWLLCDSYFMATHCEETPRWVGCALPEAFQVRAFFRTHYELFTPASALKLLRTFPPGAVVEAMTQWVGTEGLLKRAKDPLIRILGDLALHTPGDVLDPAYPWETIRADHARLTVEPTTVLADCDAGATLRFPAKRTDGDGRLAVMAALDAPADGTIILRCAPLGQPSDAAPATTIALRKGLNLIHLPVIDKPFQWMEVRLELPAGAWRFQPIPTDFSKDRVPLGADIAFTAANPLTVAMSGTGWHASEPAGTWASGPKATLLLPTFLQKGQGAVVTFHFAMLDLPGAHNHLRISSGGRALWEAVIPDTQKSAHPKVFFPPELVDKDGNLPVQIESATNVHAALGSRRLGVILTSLRIDPVEQQPLPPGK